MCMHFRVVLRVHDTDYVQTQEIFVGRRECTVTGAPARLFVRVRAADSSVTNEDTSLIHLFEPQPMNER